ncbi:hypothetical protein MYSTI_05879 [Myxococcus stipitatus DSM 14675]|uniref:Lipoprotein n=1 Tax=Myxococcus stipitatus (strain DSM 14675 / JCM 12634 / Mx s8) TaxID=1278073 RepID=L7UGZ6_MYXSD|nr:carboxypeptidase regulatory-like domain-containing protein [Myxococcus stipitatus]AGC47155.1 hypothetical protein MYSTI_05879 [Myxococcus stipitatus DSM 14675]
MTLRTLGLTMLGAAGLLSLSACKKEEAAPAAPPSTPSAPSAAPAPVAEKVHAASPIQAPSGKGVVKGTVTFTGTPPPAEDLPASSDPACEGRSAKDESVLVKDGKLQNVLVRVRGAVEGVSAPSTPVVVDQSKCTYVPRVQGAMVGQSVAFKNSDGTLHNVRGLVGAKAAFNVAQPPMGAAVNKPVPADEVLKLKCDIHPWMTAYVLSNANPFYATTGADGAFTLQGMPAGTYTVEAWHETFGTKTAEVVVKDDAPTDVSFAFSAADASAKK